MINSPLYIFDNTGVHFYSENDYFVTDYALSGYAGFHKGHIGLNTSYFCKSRNGYEVGLGKIDTIDDRIIIKRVQVLSSSDNNNPINFNQDSSNALYSFANSYNFKTGFNNCIEKNSDFIADNTLSTYLVNVNKQDITVRLPEAKHNQNLVLEFKTSDGPYSLYINCINNDNISTLYRNSYAKFISTGNAWIELSKNEQTSAHSVSAQQFQALNMLTNNPLVGISGAIQFNNNGDFGDANIYVGDNNKILLGSTNEAQAYAVLPTSGNYSTILNQQNTASDFIVRGSGDKSLFFGYDGRLGINIPSGSRPQTSLHIINNSCQESIRLENRNQCYPANLTLYHKPSTVINDNSIIGTISLSAKNSSNNQIEYSQIRSRALSYVSTASSGELAIAVHKNNLLIESIVTNADHTLIRGSNNSISISSSGINLNGQVRLSSLKWGNTVNSGLFLVTDNNNNLVLTPISNTPIIDLLDGEIIAFTGACT